MKIVQIMPEFGIAGAEIMCENLIYELEKLKQEVFVISLYDYHSAITERLESHGIKIEYLGKKPGLDISMIHKISKILRRERPDVIHTHRYVMQYAIPAAILSRVLIRVHTVHNVAQKENSKIARKLAKIFYKVCKVIPVALSNEIKRTIIEEYDIQTERVPVVLNGIDLSNCIEKTSYDVEGNFKILHIGRFSEQKNHKGLLEAFLELHKVHQDTELLLIGEGALYDDCVKFVIRNNLEDCVKFLGVKNNVYEDLENADLFVLPSLYEGIPMTLIEAMGTGLPILATSVGGVVDMIENMMDGVLTDISTCKITEYFIRLYEDYELRKKIGENAKAKSKEFSAKKMAERYLEIYCNAQK